MENNKISQSYAELNEYLLEHIPHDSEDEVTIESLICSCAEFESTEQAKYSAVIPDLINHGKSISFKFSNIKFNLCTALDIILLTPTEIPSQKLNMVQFIIKLFRFVCGESMESLDENMTIVIKAIYMSSYDGHGATMDKIKLCCKDFELIEENIQEAIEKLEEIKCIRLENGEYILLETVLLNIRD
ncbi:MAG: hypothetical protein IJA10_14780 [Lachnospiraceae bacterium]|nr:hypothetical protein [Lachnospiraceae bacterium]